MKPSQFPQSRGRHHADRQLETCSDRRRSHRRQFRRAVRVSLLSCEFGEAPAASGTLLNLSADGLALHLLTTDMDAISVGGNHRISFDLGVGVPPFELPGCISNIVDGATPDRVVVGVEFINTEGGGAERQRLRDALRTQHLGGE